MYEQGAGTFLKRWGARRKRPPALLLEWMAGLSRGAVLLDLGCGGGQDAEELRRKGYRVVGMDLTAAFLRTAREEAPLLPLVRADMRELPFRAASFDGVWAAASLIHLPKTDAARVLKVLSQIAGPGATLAATLTYGTKSGVLTKGWMPGRYFARWQKPELARVVERSGWTIESVRVVSNQERKGRWINLIARRG
ncbi:class I SAM-dependent methyltransferase [Nitrospira sp. NS4]|uniref:class I SAM-dependent methyltransferase n=1 Tax=Nitrospira sp. NS4 TaxID=3414498 RepID=UPI003C2D9886